MMGRLTPILFLSLLVVPFAAAQDPDTSEAPRAIALLTGAPGHNEPSAWYGHSSLAVDDGETVWVYTYRLQWNNVTSRAVSSALGGSTFELHRSTLDTVLDDYREQGRAARQLDLGFDNGTMTDLWTRLEAERLVTLADPPIYDPIDDNCSVRIRDLVDDAMDGALQAATQDIPGPTAREAFGAYMAHDGALHAFTMFAGGPRLDAERSQWDSLFMPEALEAAVGGLVGQQPESVLAATGAIAEPDDLRIELVVAGWAVGALIAGLAWIGRRNGNGWSVAGTILGVAVLAIPTFGMVLVWIGDMGPWFQGNRNILVAPPTMLVVLVAAVTAVWSPKAWHWARAAAVLHMIMAITALLLMVWPGQQNLWVVAAALPIHFGIMVATHVAAAERARPMSASAR